MHHFSFNSETSYWFLALIFINSELYYYYYFFSGHRTDLLLQSDDFYSSYMHLSNCLTDSL